MALPQNPDGLTAGDRALLSASLEQTNKLKAQTKVLEKLTDVISKQQKEYSNLRKDIQESQKKLFEGNGKSFSEIKKYFQKQQTPGSGVSNKSKMGDKDPDQKGLFRTALNKLFGPSKYQQKMIDDTSAIRDISESTQEDINYIKTRYEEPARAKERELLAQAIADKINDASEGGSSGSGKGLLGGALAVLGSVLSVGLDLLYKGLKTALFAVMGGIVTGIISGLGFVLGKVFDILKSIFDRIGFLGGMPGTGGNRGPGQSGAPPVGIPTPTGPSGPAGPPQRELPNGQGRLPGPNNPRLPGPVEDATIKREGGRGTTLGKPPKFGVGKGGILAGIAAALGITFLMSGDENDPIVNGNNYLDKIIEEKQQKSLDVKLNKERENIGKPGYDEIGRKLEPAEKSILEQAKDVAQTAITTTMDTTKDLVGSVSERLKEQLVKLAGLEDDVIEMAEKYAETSKNYLNKIGEIEFTTADGSKQSLNLLPNLGTYTIETLKSVIEETNKIAGEMEKSISEKAVSIINSTTNNVVQGNDAPAILPPATSTRRSDSVDRFLMEMGRIR